MTNLRKISKSKSHLIGGSLLILLGIGLFVFPYFYNQYQNKQEELKIEQFFVEEKESVVSEDNNSTNNASKNPTDPFIAVLEIPNINLKKGLYDIHSKNNIVSKGIQIIKESDMPNVVNGNFILASHSGTGRIAYFNKLNQLRIDDKVYVYYDHVKYTYQIIRINNVVKDGTIEIERLKTNNMITLTTCSQSDKEKQLILIGQMVNKEEF